MQGKVAGDETEIYRETPKTGNFGKSPWSLDRLKTMFDLRLDPCAMNKETSCCDRFYTPEQDGLKQPWDENVFLNMRYDQIYEWLQYGMTQILEHNITIVALLPSYTGTDWFEDFATQGMVIPIRGRIDFWKDGKPLSQQINPKTNKKYGAPNFDSILVVWGEGIKQLE